MTPTTAPEKRQTKLSSSSPTAIRKSHTDLLDQLARTLVRLGRARKRLSSAIESGDAAQYESAFFELEQLRADCSNIRSELEWRHAQYQLAELL